MENRHSSLEMNNGNEHFSHGSEWCSALPKTDQPTYVTVIQQDKLRSVTFFSRNVLPGRTAVLCKPNLFRTAPPSGLVKNLYYGNVLVASKNIFSRCIT